MNLCQREIRDHNDTCTNKSHCAAKVNSRVWDFASDLLKDTDRLRARLDKVIDQEREASRGEPEWQMKSWLEKLAEVDHRRGGYLQRRSKPLTRRRS